MKKIILTLASVLLLSTQAMAQAATNYFVGTDARITCDEDGEADKIILGMSYESKGDFKTAVKTSGTKLSKELSNRLFIKAISGKTFEDEVKDMVKKAVCLSKVVVEQGVKANVEVTFKENLKLVEDQLKKNKAELPATYDDAEGIEEQNRVLVNEVLFANRGAVAFMMTMFGN